MRKLHSVDADIAACMYHTGMDPFTKKPVHIAKHLRDRKLQRVRAAHLRFI